MSRWNRFLDRTPLPAFMVGYAAWLIVGTAVRLLSRPFEFKRA